MTTGTVFNIQRFSIHDGPGIRTTVFLKGCPLDCRWCANPESKQGARQLLYTRKTCVGCGTCVRTCPRGALKWDGQAVVYNEAACIRCMACAAACPVHALTVEGEEWTVEALVAEALKDEAFYRKSGGGVTLSGGEPLQQKAFTLELLRALRAKGIHTAMETSGYADADTFAAVLSGLDLLYIDCKHPDSAEHERMTGVPNGPILQNIATAASKGVPMAVRIPVIPRFNDSTAVARSYVETLAPMGVRQVHLLPFHQMGKAKWEGLGLPYLYKDEPSMQKEALEPLAAVFRAGGFAVQLGG